MYLHKLKIIKGETNGNQKIASAGTVESSDILITIAPNEQEQIELSLESSVEKQFGETDS